MKKTLLPFFERSIEFFQHEELEPAERAYHRIQARESIVGIHALAFEVGLKLNKGNCEDAFNSIKFVKEHLLTKETIFLSYLVKILKGNNLKEPCAQKILEDILTTYYAATSTPSLLNEETTINTALYITAAIRNALDELYSKFLLKEQQEEVNTLIRDTVYTAVFAKANYAQFESCKTYVDQTEKRQSQINGKIKLLIQLH